MKWSQSSNMIRKRFYKRFYVLYEVKNGLVLQRFCFFFWSIFTMNFSIIA